MNELIYLPYSPWSEKARWALDAHGIGYRKRVYTPMIGEPGLRLRLRTAAPVSVPVLLVDGTPIRDSWQIALWSAEETDRAPILNDDSRPHAEAWNATSERALAAGRARTTRRVMLDREALAASVPAPMDRLGPATTAIGWLGARWLHRRYCRDHREDDACRTAQRRALDGLRSALDHAGGDHLTGTFSYADVCAAVMLHFVSPPDVLERILAPAAVRCWRDDELAGEYADLVAWRDRLYDRYRRTVMPPRER